MPQFIKTSKVRSECNNYIVVLKIKHYPGIYERKEV